jgi:cholesterol oxidase
MLETANAPSRIRQFSIFMWHRVRTWLSGIPHDEISSQVARFLGSSDDGVDVMPLLGMGRDVPDGTMSLRRNRSGKAYMDVDWRNVRSAEYFKSVANVSRNVANAMGGKLLQNPDTRYFNRLITVHPLGGCSMGATREDGVVDSFGEVFGYKNLYIADGSVMPGPTGSNPSLTIAALADRFAGHIVR